LTARRGVACLATPRAYLATPRAAWPDRQRQHTPAPGRIASNPKPAPKSCAGACSVPPDGVGTVPPHPSKPRQCHFSGAGCVFVSGLVPWGHPTQLARSETAWHGLQPRRWLGLPSQAPARRFIGGWLRFLGWVGAWGGVGPSVALWGSLAVSLKSLCSGPCLCWRWWPVAGTVPVPVFRPAGPVVSPSARPTHQREHAHPLF
jgi:hypothetical protein